MNIIEHKQYPDAEERKQIMERRNQLSRDLIEYMVTRSDVEHEAREQINPIVHQYGFNEVYRMLQKISPRLNTVRDPDQDERWLYEEYIELYRRFGGNRQLLPKPEFLILNEERAMLLAGPLLKEQPLSPSQQHRLDELSDVLLSESFLWDDLVPEAPPQPGVELPLAQSMTKRKKKIGRNEACPCGSGRKYKHCHGQ